MSQPLKFHKWFFFTQFDSERKNITKGRVDKSRIINDEGNCIFLYYINYSFPTFPVHLHGWCDSVPSNETVSEKQI